MCPVGWEIPAVCAPSPSNNYESQFSQKVASYGSGQIVSMCLDPRSEIELVAFSAIN